MIKFGQENKKKSLKENIWLFCMMNGLTWPRGTFILLLGPPEK